MDGSTYAGAAALITAGDPAELIERAALLEAAGSHRSDVLVRVAVLQEQATAADAVAREAVATAAGAAAARGRGARRGAGRRGVRARAGRRTVGPADPAADRAGLGPAAARGPDRCAGGRRPRRAGDPPGRRPAAHAPAALGQPEPGRRRRHVGRRDRDRRRHGLPRPALRLGRRRHERPRPGARPGRGRHRVRLQWADPVRLRAGRHLDPAQQPRPVRGPAQGGQQRAAGRGPRLLGGRPVRPGHASATWRSTSATARSCRRRRAGTSSRCRPCGGRTTRVRCVRAPDDSLGGRG